MNNKWTWADTAYVIIGVMIIMSPAALALFR